MLEEGFFTAEVSRLSQCQAFGGFCGCSVDGWGAVGEGWHCEVFEAGCLAQMSQAEGGVVTSGEMSASSSSVFLGLEWQDSGFVEGVVPG